MHRLVRRPPVIFLMGPTASGKTALACELARRYPVALVSVDSAMVYRGMDIGAAKPDSQTLRQFPHGLIDIRDPGEAYSAAEFSADARVELDRISARGRIPLLVGGTGLYFRALERGLSPLPAANAGLRATLAQELECTGKAAMHARLAALDPLSAARLNMNDSQRVQRALEVIELSGQPLSALQGAARMRLPFRVLKLALLPGDRAPLHARIAERFDNMLAQGLIAELQRLRERADWSAQLPAMRAVGYRQGWPHIEGRCSLDEFRSSAIHATRQLAKRQITWLRAELDAWAFDADHENVDVRVAAAIGAFLDR